MSAGSDQPGSLPATAGESDAETLYAEAPAEEARPASLIDSIVDATSGTAARSDVRVRRPKGLLVASHAQLVP